MPLLLKGGLLPMVTGCVRTPETSRLSESRISSSVGSGFPVYSHQALMILDVFLRALRIFSCISHLQKKRRSKIMGNHHSSVILFTPTPTILSPGFNPQSYAFKKYITFSFLQGTTLFFYIYISTSWQVCTNRVDLQPVQICTSKMD